MKTTYQSIKARTVIVTVLSILSILCGISALAQETSTEKYHGREYLTVSETLYTPNGQFKTVIKSYISDNDKKNFFEVTITEKNKSKPVVREKFKRRHFKKYLRGNEVFCSEPGKNISLWCPYARNRGEVFYVVINDKDYGSYTAGYHQDNLGLNKDQVQGQYQAVFEGA